jgi:CheY-like chemotaxis protein
MPRTILVVDDNEVNRILLVRQLGRLGYPAETVTGGHQAVEAVRATVYALVFMDYRMPGMDGLEAVRQIREEEAGTGRSIPIVALTANAMNGDREACLASGMDAYLSKPVTLESLEEVLRRFVSEPAGPTGDADEDDVGPEVVSIYLAELAGRLSAIREAVLADDADSMALAAHTLKSTSALVGAGELAELCRKLEACGRRGLSAAAAGELPMLDDEVESVRRRLGSAFTATR